MKRTPLKRTSSLKAKSTLKSYSTLKSHSTLKSYSTLKAHTTLSSSSILNSSKPLSTDKSLTSNKKLSPKRKKPASNIDNSALPFAPQKRVKDMETFNACKLDYCEMCGHPTNNGPHHIFPRGAGGPDIPENLIQLCPVCHTKAHSGAYDKQRLLNIVARRLNINPQEQLAKIQKLRGRI